MWRKRESERGIKERDEIVIERDRKRGKREVRERDKKIEIIAMKGEYTKCK